MYDDFGFIGGAPIAVLPISGDTSFEQAAVVVVPLPQGNLSFDQDREERRLRKRRKFEDTQRQRVNETIDRILNPPPPPPQDLSRDIVTLAGKMTEAEAAAAMLAADDDEAILAIILAA